MHYRLVLVSTPKSKSSKRNDASILVEKYIQLASIFIQLSNRNRLRQNRWTIFAWCFLSLLIPSFSREFKNTQKTKYINENGTLSIFKEEKIRTLNEDIVIQGNGKKIYIYIHKTRVLFDSVNNIRYSKVHISQERRKKGEGKIGFFNEHTVWKNNAEITRIIWKNPVELCLSLPSRLISESVDKVKMIKPGRGKLTA